MPPQTILKAKIGDDADDDDDDARGTEARCHTLASCGNPGIMMTPEARRLGVLLVGRRVLGWVEGFGFWVVGFGLGLGCVLGGSVVGWLGWVVGWLVAVWW